MECQVSVTLRVGPKTLSPARMTTFYQIAGYGQCQFFARMLARHYGFTDEELDFIINYDIKYRMGKDAEERV
jgi:hypothetical protein